MVQERWLWRNEEKERGRGDEVAATIGVEGGEALSGWRPTREWGAAEVMEKGGEEDGEREEMILPMAGGLGGMR
jgi:hypothetical protein